MNTSEKRNCQNCHREFAIEPEDFDFYKKIDVPPPTWCPECRRQRRLSWRNDFVFYNRKCDLCERNIISLYNPESSQPIYCNKCWWSDKWDPKSYGVDFDFSKPFFEQFSLLRKKVPALALVNDNGIGSENCDYVQNVQYSKNCYMAMVSWKLENCMYFCYGAEAKDAVDCMGIFSTSEGIYETLYSEKCFGCRYVQNSSSLMNSSFCLDCHGCESCFQCVGLRNKKYYFQNKEYTKEEYEKIVSSYRLSTYSGSKRALEEFERFSHFLPRKYAYLKNCIDSTGNNLTNSKNAKDVFHVRRAEDCRYMENGDTETGSYDLCVGGELHECYEGLTPDHSRRALFTSYVWKSTDVFYSDFCMSSKDCFGCVGLKFGEYAIFNKIYSKDEYNVLKKRIIEHMKSTGEWGEFFPIEYSPFSYNESMAMMSFPISRDEAEEKGFSWTDSLQFTSGKTTQTNIPDDINEVGDSILHDVLECSECKRNYKIVPNELIFYRKWKIPIPRKCFFCRVSRRFALRGPSRLWPRTCMKPGCTNEFETSYAPERPEIVYCESCYQREVI